VRVRYVGMDLAWGDRARTGLAVLDEAGRLAASGSVVSDDEIAAFLARTAPGEVVVAIDAPLVVPNRTGRRDCEAEVTRRFGAYDAGAHPTNRSRPGMDPPRAHALARRFGWCIDPAQAPCEGVPVAIEVYPHPAMVALFGLGRVIPYKHKPGRDLASLQDAAAGLLDHVERVCGPTLALHASARWCEIRRTVHDAGRKSELRAVEDEVDAVVCAYLAWLWGRRDPRMEVLGDVDRGYIVVPGPPTTEPAHRAQRARVPTSEVEPARAEGTLAEHLRRTVPHLTGDEAQALARAAREWMTGSDPR
jgi:predicted RNase H-like nuclease